MTQFIVLRIDAMYPPLTHRLVRPDMLTGKTAILFQKNTHAEANHRQCYQHYCEQNIHSSVQRYEKKMTYTNFLHFIS